MLDGRALCPSGQVIEGREESLTIERESRPRGELEKSGDK
jgi:hypothetical protein